MQTPQRWFGTGHSTASDLAKAGAEAAASAVDGRTPSLVMVFCSSRLDVPAMLLAVRAEVGADATVVGCTGFAELAEDGVSAGGVAVAALGGAGFTVRTQVSHIREAGHRGAGAAAAGAMAGMTSPHTALIMLCDGLSGDPHEVVRGAYSVLGASVPLVGGFAGDLTKTLQFADETIHEDAVIGIALGSDAPIGIGIAHGWHRVDPPMIITKSSGTRIFEIDDEPALDVMLRRNGVPGGRAADIFRYPETLQLLGLSRRSGEDIRALVGGDDENRSIFGVADFPQGALCWLMGGDYNSLVQGAADSCQEAVDGLDGRPALGVLAFECDGRRTVLGPDGTEEAVRAMRKTLGDTPFTGFYTGGEIARVRGALGTHHLTLVSVALA